MPRTVLLVTSATLLLGLGAPAAFAASDCTSLMNMTFPGATLTASEAVTAGSLELQGLEPLTSLPAFCRVRVTLHPTTDSTIQFEAWLPQESWNGRLLNVGNGGFAGSISYGQMARNLRRGYATAGSDAGHQADAEDASWAYQHPEKIADFGYRAVHLTALLSKAVVKAYYAKTQEKSYFDACSDGGREALMEAQRFPDDYDGILAGAPANNWAHMLVNGLVLTQAISRDPAAYISALKLPAITQAALSACDGLDGLKDGVISDPERCRFDPAVLQCKRAEDSSCLTLPQIHSLRMIYSGAKDSKGVTIFPGLMPGDEDPSWHDWVLGNAPAGASGTNYLSGYFRYMVLNDPTWNPLTADVDISLKTAIDRTGKDVDAIDPDLSVFAAHGGKMIMYHGWNDPAISPLNSVQYLADLKRAMGSAKADDVVRLYMVPGMEHCVGGPGPNIFGQLGLAGAEGEGTGAMDMLQIWVERGKAPGPILAVKTTGTHEAPVRVVRPVCPYPQEIKYDGKGDPKMPESFACKTP